MSKHQIQRLENVVIAQAAPCYAPMLSGLAQVKKQHVKCRRKVAMNRGFILIVYLLTLQRTV